MAAPVLAHTVSLPFPASTVTRCPLPFTISSRSFQRSLSPVPCSARIGLDVSPLLQCRSLPIQVQHYTTVPVRGATLRPQLRSRSPIPRSVSPLPSRSPLLGDTLRPQFRSTSPASRSKSPTTSWTASRSWNIPSTPVPPPAVPLKAFAGSSSSSAFSQVASAVEAAEDQSRGRMELDMELRRLNGLNAPAGSIPSGGDEVNELHMHCANLREWRRKLEDRCGALQANVNALCMERDAAQNRVSSLASQIHKHRGGEQGLSFSASATADAEADAYSMRCVEQLNTAQNGPFASAPSRHAGNTFLDQAEISRLQARVDQMEQIQARASLQAKLDHDKDMKTKDEKIQRLAQALEQKRKEVIILEKVRLRELHNSEKSQSPPTTATSSPESCEKAKPSLASTGFWGNGAASLCVGTGIVDA